MSGLPQGVLRIAAALGRRMASAAGALRLRPRGRFDAVLERGPQGPEVHDEHKAAYDAGHRQRGAARPRNEGQYEKGAPRRDAHRPQQEGDRIGGRLVGAALPGEGLGSRAPSGDAVGDRVWILHYSSSVCVTSLIPGIILLGALLRPALPPFPLWAPLAWYAVWLAVAWAGTVRCGRRRFGLPPHGGLGEGRTALLLLSLVLILASRDPETARLGFWTAAAALVPAAAAEGTFLAVISLRRNLGPLRTLAIVVRGIRAAEREAWSEVLGRTP